MCKNYVNEGQNLYYTAFVYKDLGYMTFYGILKTNSPKYKI